MRLSIVADDPGYDFRTSTICRVLFNGEDVTNRCRTADEEEGMVLLLKYNEQKRAFLDPTTQEPAEEILLGKVEIFVPVNGS